VVKVKVCECCGHPIPTYHDILGLTRGQQRLFEIVERSGAAGIAYRMVVDRMYVDDPDGGPLTGNTSVNVMRANMNKRLVRKGLVIKSTGGHHAKWKLEKI